MLTNRIFGVGLGVVVLSGCVANPELAEESVAARSAAIVNGETVTQEDIGLIMLFSSAGGCSGTIISPSWVLTAAHCVVDGEDPAGVTAIRTTTGDERTGERIIIHPSLDVALVRVSQAFPIQSSQAYTNPLYTGTTQSLVGQELTCYGYGNNTLDGGFGTLRTARIPVTAASEDGVVYEMNTDAEGQVVNSGDSGGPCFILHDGQRQLTGVHSYIWGDGNGGIGGGADFSAALFRDWVDQQVFPDASIEIHSSWATGYCADVVLRAGYSRSVSSWGVHLALHEGGLGQLWNASYGLLFIGDDGPVYQVVPSPGSWNAAIPAGGSQRFGYCASKTGEDWRPEITSTSWR